MRSSLGILNEKGDLEVYDAMKKAMEQEYRTNAADAAPNIV